jgi:hypothetical protein
VSVTDTKSVTSVAFPSVRPERLTEENAFRQRWGLTPYSSVEEWQATMTRFFQKRRGQWCERCESEINADAPVAIAGGKRRSPTTICEPCYLANVAEIREKWSGDYGAYRAATFLYGRGPIRREPCESCGRMVNHRGGRLGYSRCVCSHRCRQRLYQKPRVRERYACENCTTEFFPSRNDARYCSDACRQRAYRGRRRTAKGEVSGE